MYSYKNRIKNIKKGLGIGCIWLIAVGCKITQEIPQNRAAVQSPTVFSTKGSQEKAKLAVWNEIFKDDELRLLIDSALANNFDLQITLQKIEMARAGVRLQTNNNRPDLAAGIGAGGRKFGRYTIDGVGNYDTNKSPDITSRQRIPAPFVPDFLLGVSSSWEIDLWGKLKKQRESAMAKLLASENGKNLLVTSLIAEIASAYYELLILDNELKFVDENITLQQQALDVIQVMKQSGQSNELAVELSSAQLLASKELRIEVLQLIIELENKINFLVGRYPQQVNRPQKAWAEVNPPIFTEGLPSQLLENRPDIKQAEYELIASNADLFTAKAAFYPSLNLTGGLGFQSFKAQYIFNPSSLMFNTIGGLVAPIANRRVLEAGLMASKAEQKIAYTNYQKTVMNSFIEVYNFLQMIENTNAMFGLKNEEVAILRNSINTSTKLFKFGQANYLEVITAQRNALQSQIELINLKKRQFNATIGLYRALGGGWR